MKQLLLDIKNKYGENARLPEANEKLVEQWRNMTPEEKKAVMAERVVELEERRENRASGVRNLPLAQFVDIRETVDSWFSDVSPSALDYHARSRPHISLHRCGTHTIAQVPRSSRWLCVARTPLITSPPCISPANV